MRQKRAMPQNLLRIKQGDIECYFDWQMMEKKHGE